VAAPRNDAADNDAADNDAADNDAADDGDGHLAPPQGHQAQTQEQTARRWFSLGQAAFEAGAHAEAADAFLKSYAALPRPLLLFNIAQALRLAGRCQDAARYYAEFREAAPEQAPSDFSELEAEAQRCAEEQPKANREVQPSLEPELSARPPVLVPPLHSNASVTPAPIAIHPAGGREENDETVWNTRLGVSCLVLSGATAAAGAWFAWKAVDSANETSDLADRGGTWDASAEDNERNGENAARLSVAFFATSLASSVVGTWFLLRDAPPVSVEASSEQLNLSVNGRF
jgi:tetratricopeptide (TPR) repeat protein